MNNKQLLVLIQWFQYDSKQYETLILAEILKKYININEHLL